MPINLSFEVLKDPSLRNKVKDLDIVRLKGVLLDGCLSEKEKIINEMKDMAKQKRLFE